MFATEGAHTLWSSSQTAAEELEAPILSALLLLNTLGFMCAEQRVEIPPIRQTTVMWKGFGSQVSKQSYRCSFVSGWTPRLSDCSSPRVLRSPVSHLCLRSVSSSLFGHQTQQNSAVWIWVSLPELWGAGQLYWMETEMGNNERRDVRLSKWLEIRSWTHMQHQQPRDME